MCERVREREKHEETWVDRQNPPHTLSMRERVRKRERAREIERK